MDIFLEQLVKRKKTTLDYVKIALWAILALVLSLVGIVLCLIYRKYHMGMGYLLIGAIWYGYYLLIQRYSVEFEYILTNDEMDIDKILAQSARKHVTTINFREIEICARVNDEAYSSEAAKKDGFAEIIDASADKTEDNVYFVDYHGDNGKNRVYFQPTSKMVDAMFKLNPRCFHK